MRKGFCLFVYSTKPKLACLFLCLLILALVSSMQSLGLHFPVPANNQLKEGDPMPGRATSLYDKELNMMSYTESHEQTVRSTVAPDR